MPRILLRTLSAIDEIVDRIVDLNCITIVCMALAQHKDVRAVNKDGGFAWGRARWWGIISFLLLSLMSPMLPDLQSEHLVKESLLALGSLVVDGRQRKLACPPSCFIFVQRMCRSPRIPTLQQRTAPCASATATKARTGSRRWMPRFGAYARAGVQAALRCRRLPPCSPLPFALTFDRKHIRNAEIAEAAASLLSELAEHGVSAGHGSGDFFLSNNAPPHVRAPCVPSDVLRETLVEGGVAELISLLKAEFPDDAVRVWATLACDRMTCTPGHCVSLMLCSSFPLCINFSRRFRSAVCRAWTRLPRRIMCLPGVLLLPVG